MRIETLAAEMIAEAVTNPLTIQQMMEGIATQSFPDNLKRVEKIDEFECEIRFQYSHDQIGPGKYIKHLSFSREDLQSPCLEMCATFRDAFLGDGKDVLQLPSLLPYVVQMGKLVLFNPESN